MLVRVKNIFSPKMAGSLSKSKMFLRPEAFLEITNIFQQAMPELEKKSKSAKPKKLSKKELNEIGFQSKDDDDSSDESKIDVNEVIRKIKNLRIEIDSGVVSDESGISQHESPSITAPLSNKLIEKLVEVLNEKSDDEIMKFRDSLRKMNKRQISEVVQNSSVRAKKMKK